MGFDVEFMGRDFGDGLAEASATRRSCSLFNFSFLARARLEGLGALSAISQLTTRRLSYMKVGQIRYALHCNTVGHAVSDLTIWRADETTYEVFSGVPQDINTLITSAKDCAVTNLEGSTILALQGPKSLAALARIASVEAIAQLRYFTCCRATIAGCECVVGRIGYTGEAGFEIVSTNPGGFSALWDSLASVANPAGFQAAEILRIEAGFPLFTQEFRIPIFPNELGLEQYSGSQRPSSRLKLVCFRAVGLDRKQLWKPSSILTRPTESGAIAVTSACFSPLAQGTLGLGFIVEEPSLNASQYTDDRGEFKDIVAVSRPFYDSKKDRPRRVWQ
jgi:aminomethyltransferase